MVSHRRILGGTLGLALLVAACGSSSATGTPSASAAPSQPAATENPTQAPADTSSPGDNPTPLISLTPGTATDLEKLLPDSAAGVSFTKTSFDGSQIPGAGTPVDSSKLDPVLSKFGKSIADVRFAIAAASSGTPMIYVLQVVGVPATDFMTAAAGVDTSTMTQATVGGKSVYTEGAAGFTTMVYAKDDKLFMLLMATDAQAQAIMAALP